MNLEKALARYSAANVDAVAFDEDGVTGNTFVDTMPSEPDLAVSFTGTGGIPWNGHGSIGVDEPTVQVRVRSIKHDPRPGKTLAWALYHQLVGLHAVTLDAGDEELHITRCLGLQTGPASIGKDPENRPEFTFNLALRVRALSAHRN